MRKNIIVIIILSLYLFIPSYAHSGILGDVDNDGKIGLMEAVNALQVTAGVRSAQSASYIIVWKSAWTASQGYQIYDAVQMNGSSYICKEAHQSDSSNQPPSSKWDIMALKGTDGVNGITPDLTPLLARISQLEGYILPYALVSNSAGDSVTPINLINYTAGSEIPVGVYPSGISRQPGGTQVWIANTQSNSLSVIDTSLSNTMAVKTISGNLGGNPFRDLVSPQSVTFNSSGSRVYVGGNSFLAMFSPGSMVPIISKEIGGAVTSLSLSSSGEYLIGIVGGHLFMISSTSAFWNPDDDRNTSAPISSIDADAVAVTASSTGLNLFYIVKGHDLLLYDDYVKGSGIVWRKRISLGNSGTAKGIAISPLTETAYVLTDAGFISVVNTQTFALTKNIRLADLMSNSPGHATAIYIRNASGRDLLYIVLGDRSSVAVIDPIVGSLVAEIPVGNSPLGIGGP